MLRNLSPRALFVYRKLQWVTNTWHVMKTLVHAIAMYVQITLKLTNQLRCKVNTISSFAHKCQTIYWMNCKNLVNTNHKGNFRMLCSLALYDQWKLIQMMILLMPRSKYDLHLWLTIILQIPNRKSYTILIVMCIRQVHKHHR